MNNETLINQLTGKNEKAALEAAKELIETTNTDAFSILVSKSEFLFDFIKANVNKRLASNVTKENFRNLIHFMNYYSADLEDFICGSLAKYANEDLTDELLEMLQEGTEDQKCYCAKYFTYIPDTASSEDLLEYAFCDNESLAYNAAAALGAMKFELGYKMALEMLNSDDDFIVLKAVKFLAAYADTEAVPFLLKAMKNSAMAENIAGEIPFLQSIPLLLENQKSEDVLYCISKILSGLGEILPLNQVFSFELYDVLNELINKNKEEKNSLIAVILLKALTRFEVICENDSYTFDEDNNTKKELQEILDLLKAESKEFWDEQKNLIISELKEERERAISAAHLISELKITNAAEALKEILNSDDKILICESVLALKALDKLSELNKDEILNKFQDENKKAIIENCFLGA